MKKLLLSIVAITCFVTGSMAQVPPDFSFEAWTNVPLSTTIQDPNGWASLNALNIVGTAQSVFKETAAPAVGLASAKIVTVRVVGATLPSPYGGNIDTAGMLVVGTIVAFPAPGIVYGDSYANRPAMLSFKSKYTPMAGDSAFVLAYMTHYNGASRDTIAWGKYETGASTTSYATNSLSMTYDPAFASVVPDSLQIYISSSVYSHDGAKIGSTFFIDDLAWSGYVGINEIAGQPENVSIYPNPSSNQVSIECTMDSKMLNITDIAGRKITSVQMQNNKALIQTSAYANGSYIYQITDKNDKVISQGKFEVAH